MNDQWCFAPTEDPAFVADMEDVLDVYHRPYDPAHPVVCLDETNRQLLGEVRNPQLVRPGHPARYDPEYVRGGVAQLFLVTEPLRGWRDVTVGTQRTRQDFARCVKTLVDVHYPDAERIVLVMDQLNIHSTASLYAAFPPEEARRLAAKLEIHHSPKHGSWLNMAELELSVLARQCLNRRVADLDAMTSAVAAWVTRRNTAPCTIDWQFTTQDARIHLRHLYPAFDA